MATYLIGDLHGCYDELRKLLDEVKFEPEQDQLYLTGDLIARGDKSLECLRFVKSLGESAQSVLGNHDLHLIATAFGIKKMKVRDRLEPLFEASDFDELIHWLRYRPLLIHHLEKNFVLVHAGISPDWDLSTAKDCAIEVEQVLRYGDYRYLLENMYDNSPERWSSDLQGIERLRYSINVFTRMRYCYRDYRLDFDCKLPPSQAPTDLIPWFNLPNPMYAQQNIVFGHWASLMDKQTPSNIYALDTGCVWGNKMTLLRWKDCRYFTQSALKNYQVF
ncbi:bis(5'-nucleosyl)-tetraphosphatase (symmetrical) ApaH [Rodentibacter caecimuris]|uniref:Bis(5'-nucleosyl)-tetraphosphatase, symmetrical n=1 Tax=Rodentibacter caecimuris TaxID=1796644 RepID=A0ABX3KW32_9PAST|nr:bis(5'-nucleosyl)-tetraphosphatase (symmetrical) [Rodentibacter heylii]